MPNHRQYPKNTQTQRTIKLNKNTAEPWIKKIFHGDQLFTGFRVSGNAENNGVIGCSDDEYVGER